MIRRKGGILNDEEERWIFKGLGGKVGFKWVGGKVGFKTIRRKGGF